MKFIFADCLDYIDPHYDFLNDSNGQGRKPYWNDVFPHEYMDTSPYDGVLVSRAIVGDHFMTGKYTESQAMRFRREGARSFLRYPEDKFPGSLLFGDCGAFQYHKMDVPPYTPEDMLEFYADGGFTHGCSVDHIIFEYDPEYDDGKPIPQVCIDRREITLDNAQKFLKASRSLGHAFQPLGVIQAWSPLSMANTALELVKMGYDYLAFGGLVPLRIDSIKQILQAVQNILPPGVRTHILGFAKANCLNEFKCFNISSFDTTSPLIRAFKDARHNYWHMNDDHQIEYYHAIRIPQAHENNKIKNLIKSGRLRQEHVLAMEREALDRIRAYAKDTADIEGALSSVIEYSRLTLFSDDIAGSKEKLNKLKDGYRRTLIDRPWEKCTCRVCREAGVEVVIFRSSNRNKRRGIHNLHAFNQYLKTINALDLNDAK